MTDIIGRKVGPSTDIARMNSMLTSERNTLMQQTTGASPDRVKKPPKGASRRCPGSVKLPAVASEFDGFIGSQFSSSASVAKYACNASVVKMRRRVTVGYPLFPAGL
mmetsp:Transcript_11614/g.28617  ORF Transcript_11614/g.28617 Transcript_11614/m.28617 type:complete len:107 (+) Transcript_11614:554-874(+)